MKKFKRGIYWSDFVDTFYYYNGTDIFVLIELGQGYAWEETALNFLPIEIVNKWWQAELVWEI